MLMRYVQNNLGCYRIFQKLDHRDKFKMKDPDDVIMYKTMIEKLRIRIFLNGLDADFEQVRG